MAKASSSPGVLAQRLQKLRETVRPSPTQRYSYAAIAAGCQEFLQDPYPPSREYISSLFNGKADNPTRRMLEALADFFDISPAYFFDDAASLAIQQDLELYAVLAERGIGRVQLRALANLDEDGIQAVRDLLTKLPKAD
ncbi:helix-turn-helix domain-containing protein [Actinokineospora sp. HUAS TT18]|uniref:helix-turn-helix domain-containing protein n=1 Tax=Actinokineospora sp. HUAS TT18 TaxID=3447451 RepID=UPI003F529103